MKKMQVALIDDKAVFRKAMKTLIERAHTDVAVIEYEGRDSFIPSLETMVPDVVFMDIEMPEGNGIQVTKESVDKSKNMIVIGLSLYDSPNYIEEIMKAGAHGYLLKYSNNQSIIKQILENPYGGPYFSEEISHFKTPKRDKNILLVDRFLISTQMVGHELKKAGYKVLTAQTAEEAWNYFSLSRLDLVISEYDLDKSTAIDLFEHIQLNDQHKRIPFIVLSSDKDDAKHTAALKMGISAWWPKPFSNAMISKLELLID